MVVSWELNAFWKPLSKVLKNSKQYPFETPGRRIFFPLKLFSFRGFCFLLVDSSSHPSHPPAGEDAFEGEDRGEEDEYFPEVRLSGGFCLVFSFVWFGDRYRYLVFCLALFVCSFATGVVFFVTFVQPFFGKDYFWKG